VSPVLDSVRELSTRKQQFLHRAAIPKLEQGFEMIFISMPTSLENSLP
jgi:hypothetical protein